MNPRMFVILLSSLLLVSCAHQSRDWPLPTGVKAIQVNGYDMAYAEQGVGTPLVLVHGALSDHRYFASAMEALAKKHRVIAVSLRHYYPEPWKGVGGSFSPRQHAGDVAAFIRALNVGAVHLFGHSRGGSIVLYVASSHPELVRTVTVGEGGSSIPAFAAADPAAAAAENRGRERSRNALALFDQGKIEEGLAYFVNDVSGPGAWSAATEANREMFRANAWTMKGTAQETFDPYTCTDVNRIKAPIFFMLGESTAPLFRNVTAAIQSCLMKSERAVVSKASHAFPRQNPTGFAEALLGFTAKH